MTGQWKIVGFGNGTGPTGGTTLNFGDLNRADHAMLLFLDSGVTFGGAPSATSLRIFFANLAPDATTSGLTRSVIPWASNAHTNFGAPNDLMTYDANGFRPLDVATETTPTLIAGANVWATSGTMTIPTGGLSINSHSLSGLLQGSATTTTPGDVLAITSGVVGSLNIRDATVNFPNGAHIHTASSIRSLAPAASQVPVGSRCLVERQSAIHQYACGGNTFTGGLYINDSASVKFTANNQLGNDDSGHASGSIVLGGGTLFTLRTCRRIRRA